MMPGDKSLALCQSVWVCSRFTERDASFRAPPWHKRVEHDIDADMGKADNVIRVDHHIEVRDHIPFDIVFPRDDTPPLAVAHMRHDLGDGAFRHRSDVLRQRCKHPACTHRRLMSE